MVLPFYMSLMRHKSDSVSNVAHILLPSYSIRYLMKMFPTLDSIQYTNYRSYDWHKWSFADTHGWVTIISQIVSTKFNFNV